MAHDLHLRRRDHSRIVRGRSFQGALAGLLALVGASASGSDIEQAPIHYSETAPRNPVARLQEGLDAGTTTLEYERDHGYLRSLLRHLQVPESSQVLVFSKTSLQRDRISPKTPRAIYFNDEVMVGFTLRGQVLEVSAADEAVGTAFYTVDQERASRPSLVRQTESCLVCHGASANDESPGHLVRSLYADRRGQPILSNGSFRTDHSSPFEERWGGWYVTGTSGSQKHLGNLICEEGKRPEDIDNAEGVNVVDLKDRFTTAMYPTPHSDIVALMVLEHQVGMLNKIARASLETRMALHYQREMNKALERPIDERSDSAWRRIRSVGDKVVGSLLLSDEIRLTDRVEGTSPFASEFAERGPRDHLGRSLRDFDLKTRMFRYPCSYLIYSKAFDALPDEVKEYVYQRLWDVLGGRETGKEFAHLSKEDRRAILEILRETKPNLPDYWKGPSDVPAPG
jgi:hypothetical protein